jgi:hypothetical protein
MSGLMIASPQASAVVIDNFESYSTGNLPLGPSQVWQGPVPALGGGETITVESNVSNNLSGQHLQFTTTYPTNGISTALPSLLSNDGDYVQYAVRVQSGQTYAGMHLLGAALSDPNAQPPGAFGIAYDNSGHVAFTAHHNGVYNYDVGDYDPPIPWVDGATPSVGTWYYLRATMRDNGGAGGVIDSYDIDVYDSSMSHLASKLGVPFHGGEGPISYVALVQNEQAGASSTALFDQISMEVVPEPASLGLLAGAALLGLRRRRAD